MVIRWQIKKDDFIVLGIVLNCKIWRQTKQFWPHRRNRVDCTILPVWSKKKNSATLLCSFKQSPLGGSFVQTMSNPICAHLSSWLNDGFVVLHTIYSFRYLTNLNCHTFKVKLFRISGPSQGPLYKQPRDWLIHSVSHWAFSSHSFTAPHRPNG